uniref:NPR3 like, GATOR1 complex subunit n=1 Tax=Callorhinchus milii TaxID=7868 RepID=A0A4W3H2A6_CALMI
MGEESSPVSVILVSSGSRGNKLLFRYPFLRPQEQPGAQTRVRVPGSLSRPTRVVLLLWDCVSLCLVCSHHLTPFRNPSPPTDEELVSG